MEPSVRVVLGHAIDRRDDRCPVCDGRAAPYLVGTPGPGDEVWRRLWPHPACVLRDPAEGSATRAARVEYDPARVPLGTVRAGSALWGRPERLRCALERHRRGDIGTFGRLARPARWRRSFLASRIARSRRWRSTSLDRDDDRAGIAPQDG